MDIREVQLDDGVLSQLIDMSVDWEREGACYGYRRNGPAELIMLGTATKNFRAILHFYIDELGMQFWSARLFKRLGEKKAGE